MLYHTCRPIVVLLSTLFVNRKSRAFFLGGGGYEFLYFSNMLNFLCMFL